SAAGGEGLLCDRASEPDLLVRAPPLAQALELGLEERCPTLRADAVGEVRLGVLLDVALDLLPVVPVVAHLLAVRTDRQEPPAQLHARERRLELFDPAGAGRLGIEQPRAAAR